MLNDELKIYRGEDFVVSKHIVIHQPTLNEICSYGEQKYYSMVYKLTSTPQSMKWQLWDAGIDYTEITSFELFCNYIYNLYSQKDTAIIFGDLDLKRFKVMQQEDDSIILYQVVDGDEVFIDEFTYNLIMDYLRQVHRIIKDDKMPANKTTKMILIEDDREEYERNKNKEYHSQLINLISSLINCDGFKYNHTQIWDMRINAFMDSVRRIQKIKDADLLLQSGYSGFGVDLNKIDNKKIDWLGELE